MGVLQPLWSSLAGGAGTHSAVVYHVYVLQSLCVCMCMQSCVCHVSMPCVIRQLHVNIHIVCPLHATVSLHMIQ